MCMRAPKPPKPQPTPLVVSGMFHGAGKIIAVVASTGAAIASIIATLYSYGMVGETEAHQSIGNLGAAWGRLQPSGGSAIAIGDTAHCAATVAARQRGVL